MTLAEFIENKGWTLAQAAEALGLKHARSVQRYAKGERFPRPALMRQIVERTGGAVQPADFYAPPPPSAGLRSESVPA